ncbi:MAG: efflux RND transporter periplasmic adaptor subunit, partial [Brachymonas denitrificans]
VAPTGGIAQAELDLMRSRAVTAGADVASARADERVASERLSAARAVLAEEGRASSSKTQEVAAPVDGVVLRRMVESAAPVPVGQPLMEVGDAAALEIESDVLSTDAVRLAPGMGARILRWGGEGVLQATVKRVEPGGFTKVSALGVEEQRTRVVLDFASPHAQWERLGDGYRVEVQFLVQRKDNLLQVPASALFRAGEGWAVYRIGQGKARRTLVKLGLRSATVAEVLEGLKEGDQVIVQPDDRIREGTRIREGAPSTQ